ncbi:MAG: hypothetical protein GKR92_02465 [Gammaproteobacteria bacterium]|nr:MAG: hypothetical protein GKR92_02465 [Gammaproteobacteria bacterium]
MTYILANERDKDAASAFEEYKKYLTAHKDKFSESVFKLASSDWWYDFNNHKCPHDAWLERALISEPSKGERNENRTTEVILMLLGANQDGYIELSYKNVVSINLDSHNVKLGHKDWRYDEFRYTKSGLFVHEIEWSGSNETANWEIEAEDIEYSWHDK